MAIVFNVLIGILLLSVYADGACKKCSVDCGLGGDCLDYDMSQVSRCTEVTNEAATNDARWANMGLAMHTDQVIKGGEIVAYKIQWFSGKWSNWFVTGVNDIDCKFNIQSTCSKSMRRWWASFADHVHTYIICYNS